MTSATELHFAEALQHYAVGGGAPEERGRALDLKLMIEQMNEVAVAVGEVTAQCGNDDTLGRPPCDQLTPLIDDSGDPAVTDPRTVLKPGFEVSLRSPIVPPWFRSWQHDIRVTAPMERGQCTAVFKETRGLLARLVLDPIIIVTDPWVATFGVPRGTAVPIWTIRWIPVQYVKVWNLCNTGTGIETTVSQRIKRDLALNFFWRFYPKDP